MINSNWKKLFVIHGLYKNNSAIQLAKTTLVECIQFAGTRSAVSYVHYAWEDIQPAPGKQLNIVVKAAISTHQSLFVLDQEITLIHSGPYWFSWDVTV